MRSARWLFGLVAVVMLLAGTPAAGKVAPESTGPRLVVGESRPMEIVFDAAEAMRVGDEMVWSRLIEVKGATYLKLHLVDVNLRAGDELRLIDPDGRVVDRIERRGPKSRGTFWTLSAFDDHCLLEFRFTHEYPRRPFRVDRVMVGLVDVRMLLEGPETICTPADFEDVACYQDDADKWANVLASVGVMDVGDDPASDLWCSGSNVSPLNYVMTNYHCVPDAADCTSAEFVFSMYHTTCGGGELSTPDSYRCDETVVSSPYVDCEPAPSSLDFSLSSVIGDPASTWGYVTPDPDAVTSGEGIYIVQHPAGRPHEITHGSGDDVVVDGHTLRYYDTLDTEGGSSGSPIYREADDQMVGLHHCGGCSTPGVGNRGMLMSDIYPLIEAYLCTPTLQVAPASWQSLVEVEGNGDAVMDPGETWQMTPVVRNQACSGDALNVRADLAVASGSDGPVTLLDTLAEFGDIPAGQTAAAAAPIAFELDTTVPCGGEVVLDLTNLTADNGGPFDGDPGYFSHQVGELVKTTLFFEDFAGGIPAEWTVADGGTNPATPVVEQTWAVPPTDNSDSVSLTAPFAICDSDGLGSGYVMDEELITPAIDCTGYDQVELQFAHDFDWYSSSLDEQCDVDVRSGATGGAWVTVANFSGGDAGGSQIIDISAQAVGQSDVEVRFHYYDADYEWWWAVDNVQLLGNNGFVCTPYDPQPTAGLSGPVQVCDGTAVQFADESSGADSWAWDFETDGTVDDTSETPAPVTYPGPGTYTCTLDVTNASGTDTAAWDVEVIGTTSAVAGDADGDSDADAADLVALMLEIDDADGTAVGDRCGAYGTTDQVDASGDGLIDAADLPAMVGVLFQE